MAILRFFVGFFLFLGLSFLVMYFTGAGHGGEEAVGQGIAILSFICGLISAMYGDKLFKKKSSEAETDN